MRKVMAQISLALTLTLACSDDSGPANKDAGADMLAQLDGAGADQKAALDKAPADLPPPDAPQPYACTAGNKTGKTGSSDNETTQAGIKFNVRVPASYKAALGSPLIVVYAAAGGNPQNMETFTGLTSDGNAKGYIVVYVDHVSPNNANGVWDIAKVPQEISKKWCVDPSRIYLTGHSNGGSVIYIMQANNYWSPLSPAAIAPSAAGLSKQTFTGFPCPKASPPVMVLHSKNDTLFLGYGRDARDWWVGCKGCSTSAKTMADGCLAYTGCKDSTEVQYCESGGSHGTWPKVNGSILAFFGRFRRAGK